MTIKLQVYSDLHIPHGHFDIPKMESDVIILAGDIHVSYEHTLEYLIYTRNYHKKPIVFIPGNHEYYNCNYTEEVNKWENTHEKDIHILNINTHWDFMGYRFIGDTLWTDVSRNPIEEIIIKHSINDFQVIDSWDTIKCSYVYRYNVIVLVDAIKSSIFPVICVTHHAPSYGSIPEEYKTSNIINAFATPLDATIESFDKLKIWIHGHCHQNSDYYIGKTRVLCNPKGYNNENPDFIDEYVIELL
jgi:Icc-related predicted phosphoesterase